MTKLQHQALALAWSVIEHKEHHAEHIRLTANCVGVKILRDERKRQERLLAQTEARVRNLVYQEQEFLKMLVS